MGTHIDYALNRIYQEIPKELLADAHTASEGTGFDYSSLESRIIRDTINGILTPDLNIASGDVETLDITGLPRREFQTGTAIFIPPRIRQGRDITEVFTLEYGYSSEYGGNTGGMVSGSPNYQGSTAVYMPVPNTIASPKRIPYIHIGLRCRMENDAEMRNMANSTKLLYGDMAVLAEKGFIHKELSLNSTYMYMNGGASSGKKREIIDSYSDSFELLRTTHLKRWRKITIMANKDQHYALTGLRISR